MTESRFRKVVSKFREGWTDGRQKKDPPAERFMMKPGEVRIIRGGKEKLDRQPGEPRG